MHKDTDTRSASRMLVLWLELQEALRDTAQAQPAESPSSPRPWECENARVRAVWSRITDPQNEAALMEWLMMVGPGQDETWAHEAIRECQRRKQKP